MISKILIGNIVKTRTGQNIKYKDVNFDFFSKIDTEDKAYFLGLLYADGNVSKYTTTIKLIKTDIAIIEKFRDIMCPSASIKIIDNKYASFRINRKVVSQQLTDLGCMPCKSLILQFPKIDEKYISHFVRGYSDGDGSIYCNKNEETKIFSWTIVSTKKFCDSLNNLLKEKFGAICYLNLIKPKSENQITTTLRVCGVQLKPILDWLYKDSNIYLQRKYNKYLEYNKQIEENHLMKRYIERGGFLLDKSKILDYYVNASLSKVDISKLLSCDRKSVSNILKQSNIKTIKKNSYSGKNSINFKHGKEIVEMFNLGTPLYDIAKKFNCTPSNISIILKKNNISVKKKNITQETIENIFKLSGQKFGTRKIAKIVI